MSHTKFFNSSLGRFAAALIFATATLLGVTWALGTTLISTTAEDATPPALLKSTQGDATAQIVTERERVQAEVITLRPTGFEPAEVIRPQGRVLLAFNNRSGLENVTLRLDGSAGERLREVSLPLGQTRWRKVIDLAPGEYVLTVADHPDWVCRITVTRN